MIDSFEATELTDMLMYIEKHIKDSGLDDERKASLKKTLNFIANKSFLLGKNGKVELPLSS